jgi:hypothetical protein
MTEEFLIEFQYDNGLEYKTIKLNFNINDNVIHIKSKLNRDYGVNLT